MTHCRKPPFPMNFEFLGINRRTWEHAALQGGLPPRRRDGHDALHDARLAAALDDCDVFFIENRGQRHLEPGPPVP
jgi:hypothetical protein